MSFRKDIVNWKWRYFFAPGMPDVLENVTGFIDETLDLGNGTQVTGQPFDFYPEGFMNVFDVIPDAEKGTPLNRTILTADFDADEPGVLTVGLAADWQWSFRFNGKMLLDARRCSNSEFPIHYTNHTVELAYQKGRNQVVFEIFSTFGRRGIGGGMDTTLKIVETPLPLDFKYKAFVAFPDADENALSVIFTGNRKSPAAVDYRIPGADEWLRVYDNLGGQIRHDRAVHSVRLDDLLPDTVYEYRPVLLDDIRSWSETYGEVRTIRTAPAPGKDFIFTATADLQLPHLRTEYMRKLLTKSDFKPDFFAFIGDLEWTTFFDQQVMDAFIVPFRQITDGTMPLVMVRGNHEIYGKDSNRYFEYFTPPYPGREGYYMFRWGDVCFFSLDFCDDAGRVAAPSTRQFHDFEPYIAAEAKWLKKAVELPLCRNAKYRIVLAHGLPSGDAQKYLPGHVRQVIDPVFGGSDPVCPIHLWLGGHIHRPFRSIPGKRAFYSAVPPEKIPHGDAIPDAWNNYNFPVLATGGPTGRLGENMQFTSFEVAVTSESITVRCLDRNQQEFDRIVIAPDGKITEDVPGTPMMYFEY
ncbi:MAG: metallophosphoesterase [Lentisphaeria bacterium]|nr:metallophosphoesterase [Lentisphaeria bacterium]